MKTNEQGPRLWLCHFHLFDHRRHRLPRCFLLALHSGAPEQRLAAVGYRHSRATLRAPGSGNIGMDWLDNVDYAAASPARTGAGDCSDQFCQ